MRKLIETLVCVTILTGACGNTRTSITLTTTITAPTTTVISTFSVSATHHTSLEITDAGGKWPSIAIGDDGNPVISHYDATNQSLKLYICDDSQCSTGTNRVLEVIDGASSFSSVAIGDDGNPVIAHHDQVVEGRPWDFHLDLYICDDSKCSAGTNLTLETGEDVGYFSSVAIGDEGNPVISQDDA